MSADRQLRNRQAGRPSARAVIRGPSLAGPVIASTVLAGTALAAAVALTACGTARAPGSQAAPPSRAASHAPPSPRASSAATQAVSACSTSELQITLDSAAAGAAAGSSYVPLEFTNASGGTCTLTGYPAVVFAASVGGPQIGAAAQVAVQQTTRAATLVLAPGAVAHAWLQILDVANYPASQCKPMQASGLRVGLSGTQVAAFVAHPFQACANVLHGSDVLAVFPLQSGRARRGTAP
jgi:hypothetical protein